MIRRFLRERFGEKGALLDREAIRYLFGYFRTDRFKILLCVAASAVQSLLVVPSLWLVTFSFDTAIPEKRIDLIIAAGLAFIALRTVSALLVLAIRSRVLRLVKGAVARMRSDLVAGLYGLSHDAPALLETDRVQTQIVQDTERVDTLCNALLSNTFPALVSTLCLVLYLMHSDLTLLALALVMAPIFWAFNRITTQRTRVHVRTFQRALESFSSGVRFVLRHMELTETRGVEAEEVERQRAQHRKVQAAGETMAMSFALQSQIRAIAIGIAGGALLIVGGIAIIGGSMTLGKFMAFYVAAGMLNNLGGRISISLPEIVAGNESLLTLLRIRRAGPPKPYAGTRRIDWTGRLALSRVSFSYPSRRVLDQVSLEFHRHSNVALIGRNGSGKTTLLQILLGFRRPEAGSVEADGVAYTELDLRCLRTRIGVVPQHPDFFAGTILENLSYGLPAPSRAAVDAAIAAACADFVTQLPRGYDTPIGDGGASLSGGERQRLAIARALLARPQLLILDEPTNHLDVPTIRRLMKGLMADPGRPALLTISHDPVVIAFADEVYRLDAGRIALERSSRIEPAVHLS